MRMKLREDPARPPQEGEQNPFPVAVPSQIRPHRQFDMPDADLIPVDLNLGKHHSIRGNHGPALRIVTSCDMREPVVGRIVDEAG
ncbi:hypothetical protein D9M72_651080 [compost metagenome]